MSAPAHFNVKERSLINRESVSSTFFLWLVTEKKLQQIVGKYRINNLIMKNIYIHIKISIKEKPFFFPSQNCVRKFLIITIISRPAAMAMVNFLT